MEEFYNTNETFKRYVDKYAGLYGITVEEALKHKIIHNYCEYLKGNLKN